MKYSFIILLYTINCIMLTSQNTLAQGTKSVAGVYLLQGVMETASGFELKADSTFEFFFSQGALDRAGFGKWTVEDGYISFTSTNKRPPKDYALVSSKTMPGDGSVIKMVDENSMILSYSRVTLVTASGKQENETNSRGEARFNHNKASEIRLLFRLCPDRESVFTVNPHHNYFEFKLEPWVAEVFFDNFRLLVHDDKLTGMHPLIKGTDFSYYKEQ